MQNLDFEKPILELDAKIKELQHTSNQAGIDILKELTVLQMKRDKLLKNIYSKLTAWDRVQIARHPERPHALTYINTLFENFISLAGDRLYGEDQAIIAGIGRFRGETVMVLGQEKGHDLESRIRHNFGMPFPEGYRKAQRLMKLANQWRLPVITLVDTAGAAPGIGAEERGQAEAIAKSMEVGLQLEVPMISVIIGEGGSGGAIAIATGNAVFMLEHSVYSVISPEGCASILWHSADMKKTAAEAQKLTAQDLLKLKVIDGIIPEPLGGAHRDPQGTIKNVGNTIETELKKLRSLSGPDLRAARAEKFLRMSL